MIRAIIIIALALSLTGCAAVGAAGEFHSTCNPLNDAKAKAICKAGAIGIGAAKLTLDFLKDAKQHAPDVKIESERHPQHWEIGKREELCRIRQNRSRKNLCEEVLDYDIIR